MSEYLNHLNQVGCFQQIPTFWLHLDILAHQPKFKAYFLMVGHNTKPKFTGAQMLLLVEK